MTLAVRLGDRSTRFLYLALMALPYVLLPLLAGLGGRPLAIFALVGIPMSYGPLRAVLGGVRGPGLIPVLAGTARVQMVASSALALGLVLSEVLLA
jgi:1,4-dihydroxy-2-naphthoate octaprenyltransferase